jgi:hypothetical protein
MYPDLVSGAFLGSDTVIGKIRSYYNQGRILIGYHKSFTDAAIVGHDAETTSYVYWD